MKILQVNNVYGEKSTGKLTKQLHDGLLREGHESIVVYGRGRGAKEDGVIRLCPDWYGKLNSLLARVTGMPYGGCLLSTLRLMNIILKENPDIVHLQCINEHFVNIYLFLSWLKKRGIKTVLSLHAEFIYTANCGYAFDCEKWKTGCHHCERLRKATRSWFFDRTESSWKRMKEAMAGFEERCIIAPVSLWTQKRAQEGEILRNFSFRTVYNGVDTNVFCCRQERDAVRNKLGIQEEKVVLNITRKLSADPDNIKGGYYLLELAKRIPDVTFLVAGDYEENLELPSNVRCLGFVFDQYSLAEYYVASDLTLMVSKRETFSMPCAESLCCGTPVAGFKAGAPEQISLQEYSEFVSYGNLDELEYTVRKWINVSLDRREIAARAETEYSSATMIRNFLKIYGSGYEIK